MTTLFAMGQSTANSWGVTMAHVESSALGLRLAARGPRHHESHGEPIMLLRLNFVHALETAWQMRQCRKA